MPARTNTRLPDDAFALTPEGVTLAEELAAATFENMLRMVEIGGLDTNITAVCLIAELLAGLEYYGGVPMKVALATIKPLVAPRAAALREADAAPCAVAAPAAFPATIH